MDEQILVNKLKSGGDIGKDGVKLTISKIITLTLAMISSMLLSRFRTLAEYGTYSQILMISNIATSIFMLGLPTSINYFLSLAVTKEEQNKFLSVFYTLSTILTFIIGLLLVLSISLIASFLNNSLLVSFAYFLALFPWTRIIMGTIENVLVVNKKTWTLMVYRVSNAAIVLLTIIISHFLSLNFNTYMIAFLIVEIVYSVIVYILVTKYFGKLTISFDKTLLKNIFAFSIPIGLAGAVGTINIELDKLMISWFFDLEKVAIYSNAGRELPITIIAVSLTSVLLPELVRYFKNGQVDIALSKWRTATILSMIIMSLFVFGIMAFAPDVIKILYSEKYLPGTDVFRVYTILLLLRITYFGIVLNATGNTKYILFSAIFSLIMNIILNFLFYWWFGFVGPAIATLISQLIMNSAQLIITSKIINRPINSLFPFKEVAIILCISLVFFVFFFFIKKWLPLDKYVGSIWESVILGVIWSLTYLMLFFKKIKLLWDDLNKKHSTDIDEANNSIIIHLK